MTADRDGSNPATNKASAAVWGMTGTSGSLLHARPHRLFQRGGAVMGSTHPDRLARRPASTSQTDPWAHGPFPPCNPRLLLGRRRILALMAGVMTPQCPAGLASRNMKAPSEKHFHLFPTIKYHLIQAGCFSKLSAADRPGLVWLPFNFTSATDGRVWLKYRIWNLRLRRRNLPTSGT